jgi:membrane associated rhomboid family serine protease
LDLAEDTDQGRKREGAPKLPLGRICCLVGLLFGAGGIVFSILSASVNLSAGAVGIVFGLVGYFLGVRRRLGAAAIAVGVIALFFMAAAATGLIPGVEPLVHDQETFRGTDRCS